MPQALFPNKKKSSAISMLNNKNGKFNLVNIQILGLFYDKKYFSYIICTCITNLCVVADS